MAPPQVNGDVPGSGHGSAFFHHLLDYPVISDGVQTFKTNEYGQRSLALGDSVYQTIAAPILPWMAKPYQIVAPWVHKVDMLGDRGLDYLDDRVPAVKKPTADLYNDTKGLVFLPLHKGLEGKDHVLETYSSELKKLEQGGLVAQGKAAVTTAVVVSNETLSWLSAFLSSKKAEASKSVDGKVNN